MRLKPLAYLFLALFPAVAFSWKAPDSVPFSTEDTQMVRKSAAKVSSASPCGIWMFPDEDAEVAVVPLSDSSPDIYKIVMLFDVDMTPSPGTVLGYLSPSASAEKWHAWLYSKVTDKGMKSPREFVATFSSSPQSEEASLKFEKPKSAIKWHVNPLGMFPFLRRILSVSVSGKGSEIPYGLRRKSTTHRLRWL